MTASAPLDGLPKVRGELQAEAPLAPVTWFNAGGNAEILFRPADRDDLAQFLAQRPRNLPVTVIGVGSNLLVRDGGIAGVVIRLGRPFAGVATLGLEVHCGAAALDINVARAAQKAGIAGLEFLSGVPGSVGGALVMNAGAYGAEIKDVFVSAEAVDFEGRAHTVDRDAMRFGYRRSATPADWIFVSALLKGEKGDSMAIAAKMDTIHQARTDTQPVRARTGGSTFKNPPGQKAWELIDRAGCRGLKHGRAMVSEKHCNFLINTGGATAADIEDLGETVRSRVREATGVDLEWEIRRLGRRAS